MQEGHIPDLIIADIEMPMMDGYEFIDQVRSSGFLRHIPLIMLSGKDSSDNRIRCLEAGADDYLIKPFNPRELAARVNGILRRLGKKIKSVSMEQSSAEKKIALITLNTALAEQVKEALAGLFEVSVYNNGLALHHAMQDVEKYAAILSDDELRSANGIPLLHTLIKLGYGTIPFISIINQIDEEQRNLAMKNDIADIFAKPLDKTSIRIRVPYLVNNFRNPSAIITQKKPYHLPLIKRVFDIFFSGLALLMLSPLFLLIILLIRAESKGKVFYYSLRVGTGYQIFKFYKFRSMFTGADARLKELSHVLCVDT
eukprot:Opistho-1_new@56399